MQQMAQFLIFPIGKIIPYFYSKKFKIFCNKVFTKNISKNVKFFPTIAQKRIRKGRFRKFWDVFILTGRVLNFLETVF